jgi:hypothetical protein
MYDTPGSDSGREWVEVTNLGSESVDIGKYKLFENSTNHGLTLISGASMLAAHASAIVAADPNKFKANYPAFSGTLFDSTFSLSNTGESLILKDASTSVMDTIAYTASEDADGTGGSLTLQDGNWIAAMASPGIYPGPLTPVQKTVVAGKSTTKKTTATSPSKNTKTAAATAAAPYTPTKSDTAGTSFLLSSLPSYALWVLGLLGVILAGAAGVLFLSLSKSETQPGAEEFTIE